MFRNKSNSTKSPLIALVVQVWTIHAIAIIFYIFVLFLTVPIFGDATSLLIAAVVVPVGYLVLCYQQGWRSGARDHNLVHYGHIQEDRMKAWKACLISQIPGLLLGVGYLLGVASGFCGTAVRYFYISFVYEIQMFYASFPIIVFVPAVLPFLALPFGYSMGYHDKRIANKLVYTQKNKNLR